MASALPPPSNRTPRHRFRPGRWLTLAGVALAVVAAYLLSLGPLFYFALTGSLDGGVFDTLRATVYAPAMWLIDHSDAY